MIVALPGVRAYLSDELADAVKEANLPVSAICQRALEQAVRRVTAVHETMRGSTDGSGDDPHPAGELAELLDLVRDATTAMLPWPPNRTAACWCGSQRKYKQCCRPHGLGSLD